MESVKTENNENDPNVDNNAVVNSPNEIGELQIEIGDNSFVKMVQELSQKQVETTKPIKRQLSLNENDTKKIKVFSVIMAILYCILAYNQ